MFVPSFIVDKPEGRRVWAQKAITPPNALGPSLMAASRKTGLKETSRPKHMILSFVEYLILLCIMRMFLPKFLREK